VTSGLQVISKYILYIKNVMVVYMSAVYCSDLFEFTSFHPLSGVSRQVSEETVMLNTFYGTPLYLSPELVENRPYNEKTDMWSLGECVLEFGCCFNCVCLFWLVCFSINLYVVH
jgi:serine/threonine protein kinase